MNGQPELSADYERGFDDGLRHALAFVMAAPVCITGQRHASPEGFERMADPAVDPDGDPNFVSCTYVLRDAILGWIEAALENDPAKLALDELTRMAEEDGDYGTHDGSPAERTDER